MKKILRYFEAKDFVTANFDFSWVFFTIFHLLSFGFFLDFKNSVINHYILFIAFVLILSTAFLKDFFKREYVLLCLFLSLSFSVGCFAIYALLALPVSIKTCIFWNSSMLLLLFYLPVNIFPFSILLSVLSGTLVFFISGKQYAHSGEDTFFIVIQSVLFFLVWYFVYREKENRLSIKQEVSRENAIMMNHEFRTYLSTIQLNLETIRKKPDKVVWAIESMEKTIHQMSTFLEILQGNFKDYFPISTTGFSIKAALQNILQEYPFEGNDCLLVGVRGDDFFIYMEESVFKHVIFNMLRNALYFIKKANKGHITIFLNKGGTYNSLVFEDTGYGIKKEYLPNIFDRFYSRNKNGTGMGLYFCKKALEAYNYSIECESQFSNFTRFIIKFKKEI